MHNTEYIEEYMKTEENKEMEEYDNRWVSEQR